MAKRKPTSTPLSIKEDMLVNGIDVATPAFLKRDGSKKLTHEEAAELVNVTSGRRREWIMPDNSPEAQAAKAAAKLEEQKAKILVTNDEAPVTVSTRTDSGVKTLAVYQNMTEFRAQHDFGAYPFRESRSDKDQTVILVTAKPWAGREAKSDTPRAPRTSTGRTKAEIIGDMLLRPEGTTAKEVCSAMNWPSVSMPAQAKAAGLTLHKEKVDGIMKYWGIKK